MSAEVQEISDSIGPGLLILASPQKHGQSGVQLQCSFVDTLLLTNVYPRFGITFEALTLFVRGKESVPALSQAKRVLGK